MRNKYTAYQIDVGALYIGNHFARNWFSTISELQQPRVQSNLAPILQTVVNAYYCGKILSLNQLCDLIAVNPKTVKIRVQDAEEIGVLKFVRCKLDGRMRWVVPTEKLITAYESDIQDTVDRFRMMLNDIGRETLPPLRASQDPSLEANEMMANQHDELVREIARAKNQPFQEMQIAIAHEMAQLLPKRNR